MEPKKDKPKLDKLFWWISIPSALLILSFTVIPAIFQPSTLFITLPVLILIAYFLITPLFGYVQLRENSLFIKFGFFLKREIPYEKIRGVEKCRKFYSDSMISLKNSMEHLNIKYNRFDMVSVSVIDNDEFKETLMSKIK